MNLKMIMMTFFTTYGPAQCDMKCHSEHQTLVGADLASFPGCMWGEYFSSYTMVGSDSIHTLLHGCLRHLKVMVEMPSDGSTVGTPRFVLGSGGRLQTHVIWCKPPATPPNSLLYLRVTPFRYLRIIIIFYTHHGISCVDTRGQLVRELCNPGPHSSHLEEWFLLNF